MKDNCKKLVNGIVIGALATTMVACGAPKTINGKYYETCGLLEPECKDPGIRYEVSVGNMVWSVLLLGTVVVPIYFMGFSIFNPIAAK